MLYLVMRELFLNKTVQKL